MEKAMDRLQGIIMPFAEKMSKIIFLSALAETMQVLLPITLIGSFGCLFAFIDIGPWQSFLAVHPLLKLIFMNTQSLTLNCIGLYVVMVLPFCYATRLGMKETINVVPMAVVSFLLLTPTELYVSIPTAWLGYTGMFSAMIISFLVVRITKLFLDKNITFKMPPGVPKFIEHTFAVLIPAVVILSVAASVGQLMSLTEIGSVHNVIYTIIQTPLQKVGMSFPSLLLAEFLMTLFMFCGIHGTTATQYLTPLLTNANMENLTALQNGQELPNIFTTGLMKSIQTGGIGATLGLVIIMVVFARSQRLKQLGRMSLVPQIFNIGEPLLFGIPIMLNPVLFIPYMGGVIVNTFIAYFAVASGIISKFSGVDISWTVPSIVQGLLGNIKPLEGALLQVVILIVDMIIWYPFLRMLDKQEVESEQAAEAAMAAD